MSKRDVSNRTLKDCKGEILVSGDLVIIAYESSIRFGVFWNTFDNGSLLDSLGIPGSLK